MQPPNLLHELHNLFEATDNTEAYTWKGKKRKKKKRRKKKGYNLYCA